MTYAEQTQKLAQRLTGNQQPYRANLAYYNSLYRPKAVGLAVPPEMRVLLAHVGYPRLYLDALERRLDIEDFIMPGKPDDTRMRDWWQANNMDLEAGKAHLEALMHGRAYVTVAAPDPTNPDPMWPDGTPIFRAESPQNLYVETDPVTRKVTRALRLYKLPEAPDAQQATLLLPNETVIMLRDGAMGPWLVHRKIAHNLGVVLVAKLVNRATLASPEGQSEITPELRSVTDAASRLTMNLQAAAELMAIPQRVIFGVAAEALVADPNDRASVFEAYMGRILAIEDAEGKAVQFLAAELRNFVEGLEFLAKQAAAYTGLPPQYLSTQSDNPASAEAIRFSENRLIKHAERLQVQFESGWEDMMRLGMLAIDKKLPPEALRIETKWRDPSTPTFAAKADAITKLATATTPENRAILPVEQARIELGYSREVRREMDIQDRRNATRTAAALYGGNVRIPSPQPGDDPGAE